MSENAIYASADLGGTNIAAMLAGADGKAIAERSVPTKAEEGPGRVLDRIAELVNALAGEAGTKPAALGLGVPGLTDVGAGVTKFLPNLPTQWREVPVSASLAPKVGCPVHLLNDVRMATLGELTYGHGRTAPTFAFFALGTGIGGGVVVDGRLRLGPLGAAGELGHQVILPDGPPCGCGGRGCLETLASGPAITAEGIRLMLSGQAPRLQELVAGDRNAVRPTTMAQAAKAGDAAVARAIGKAAEYLGIAIANVVSALHPDLIVLGGGVTEMGEALLGPVRATVRDRVRMMPAESVGIERSELGTRAGALGGIALAMSGGLTPG